MPLTAFQEGLARLLAVNRSPDSYLAGGAAILIEPNTNRYSNDLDFFHDSVERVAEAFGQDRALLGDHAYVVAIQMNQPGYIRALVQKEDQATKIEWAHDSAWRFMPTIASENFGYLLHPIDLAVNKLLAVAGRDEARDFLDILHVHRNTLPLGALCWAAAGKDPGFTPWSLLELLRRRGKYHPKDFSRLHLRAPLDLPALKTEWLAALSSAETFIKARNPKELGCLYYARGRKTFVDPSQVQDDDIAPHFGRPGGVFPQFITD